MYFGDISCREDILREFQISEFEGEVVYAFYEYEDYSGTAYVIYVHDRRFYFVQGSHCSCYGLEESWEPEETSAQTIVHMIRKGGGYGLRGNDRLAEVVEEIDRRFSAGAPIEDIREYLTSAW